MTRQTVHQGFSNFWNPTSELRALAALPTWERIKLLRQWSYWRAMSRWPVIWRRFVMMFAALQLYNVGHLAVRGFQTVALERQEQAAAALGLEVAAQHLQSTKAGSAQILRARQDIRDSLKRLAMFANMSKVEYQGA
jgi:hypothetical protein